MQIYFSNEEKLLDEVSARICLNHFDKHEISRQHVPMLASTENFYAMIRQTKSTLAFKIIFQVQIYFHQNDKAQ